MKQILYIQKVNKRKATRMGEGTLQWDAEHEQVNLTTFQMNDIIHWISPSNFWAQWFPSLKEGKNHKYIKL